MVKKWAVIRTFRRVPVQKLDSTLYLANTSVAAVLASGFPLSVFRFHSVSSILRLFTTSLPCASSNLQL